MLLINADDFGRSIAETDAALRCWKAGTITSVSAMVFMADSERAAELAKNSDLQVGLHLNFTEPFTGPRIPKSLANRHDRIVRFLKGNKYSQILYNPFLQRHFSYVYKAQADEFARLFGQAPSHIDGHHHMQLCANLLLSNTIPPGVRIRRNFSFSPGEKSWLNRAYRSLVDRWLSRKYRLTNYFFDLTHTMQRGTLDRVVSLAEVSDVELMTHPVVSMESEFLRSPRFQAMLQRFSVDGSGRLDAVRAR